MDRAEFTRRVLDAHTKLYRVAYLSLGSERDVQDAVQEALLRAWRGIGSLRESAYFDTWLIRILINECRTIQRRSGARREAELPDALPAPEPPDPALRDAIRALPDKYRLPVVLHHLEGYTVNQVADALRITNPMVRWRLEKARALLRQALKGGDDR